MAHSGKQLKTILDFQSEQPKMKQISSKTAYATLQIEHNFDSPK